MTEPVPVRPGPAAYFTATPIAWAWACSRLESSRNYWVATIGTNGRPHARPVWGVWIAERFAFSTGSQTATNLAANAAVTVHLESGIETVIVEGTAAPLTRVGRLREVVTAYNDKYGWDYPLDDPAGWWEVTPAVAYGWVCDPDGLDGGAIFNSTGTRWQFPE